MEEPKTPKKYPIERAFEEFLFYLTMMPRTSLELIDKLGFYSMVSAITFMFIVVALRG